MKILTTEQIEHGWKIPFGITTKDFLAQRSKEKYVLLNEILGDIGLRIEHCNERILFWNDKPELKQVWIGIKAELESLKSSFGDKVTSEVKT